MFPIITRLSLQATRPMKQASIASFFTSKAVKRPLEADGAVSSKKEAKIADNKDQLEAKSPKPDAKIASPVKAEKLEQKNTEHQTEQQNKKPNEKAIEKANEQQTEQQTEQKAEQSNKEATKLPFLDLCSTFEAIEQTSSRLKIVDLMSSYFYSILVKSPRDLVAAVYLSSGKLGPDYDCPELGLGESLLLKAIGESTGRTLSHLKAEYKKSGDLGTVAMSSRSKQAQMFKPVALDVPSVFRSLKTIATTTGTNSQQRKISTIVRMLGSCSGVEAKYLIRSLEGKLRIGLAEKSVLSGLSRALLRHENGGDNAASDDFSAAEEQLRQGFSTVSNYAVLIDSALSHGVLHLSEHVRIMPGIPLKPMLAKPTKSVSEILDKLADSGDFTCEYKYDGERAQIHLLESGDIKIYSRNSENMTERYPDLIEAMSGFLKPEKLVKSAILDAEVVAWDREQKKILPFQVLTTRKRKAVKMDEIKVQICIFAFDCLLLNGESLITQPLVERRKVLAENLQITPGKFQFAVHKNVSDVVEIQAFLEESIRDSCEGLMVKSLNSTYEPSARSSNWLKLKKDYLSGVGDSIDLVVLGGYYGKGKRTGWYGGFLLGCYNPDTGDYETTCKIGTGFSEELLGKLYEQLSKTEIKSPKSYYRFGVEPDVWFEPTVVFEVLTADLSLSPVYKAGIDTLERGVSLRFPRFIRLRDDKGPEDATTSAQLIEMYESQVNI